MSRIISRAAATYELTIRIGRVLSPLGPTMARFVVGYVFLLSGWGKLHDLDSVAGYFTELGIPAPGFQAVLASTSEFVCGALLLAGFATRLAVVPLIVTMIVAIRTALWADIDSLITLFGKAEFLYIALLIWLGTTGPGPLSIDRAIQAFIAHRSRFRMPMPTATGVLMERVGRAGAR